MKKFSFNIVHIGLDDDSEINFDVNDYWLSNASIYRINDLLMQLRNVERVCVARLIQEAEHANDKAKSNIPEQPIC